MQTEYVQAAAHQRRTTGQRVAIAHNSKQNAVQGFVHLDNRPQSLQLYAQRAKQPLQCHRGGLPEPLKTGMENLSGISLDHVNVHYNSPKPAAVQAHAYAQGADIHLASGQAQHLPHELGHVVQQAQGRVKATTTVAGMAVNDSVALEQEATQLGAQALRNG